MNQSFPHFAETLVATLRDDPTTGRAIVSFFDPRFDLVTDRSIKFPSFCSLQFVVDDARALDCIAYFRVQEMQYWWPVNMAEIAQIQQTVVDRLWAERINLRPGSIFTVAAIALWEDTPPKVLVPLIDRISEDDSHRLRSMAYALFQPEMRDRAERLADWEHVIEDWLPPERLDRSGAPVPIDGLIALKDEIEWFAREYPDRESHQVVRVLAQMIVDNQAYLASQGAGADRFEAHAQWRLRTLDNVAQLREAIAALG